MKEKQTRKEETHIIKEELHRNNEQYGHVYINDQ